MLLGSDQAVMQVSKLSWEAMKSQLSAKTANLPEWGTTVKNDLSSFRLCNAVNIGRSITLWSAHVRYQNTLQAATGLRETPCTKETDWDMSSICVWKQWHAYSILSEQWEVGIPSARVCSQLTAITEVLSPSSVTRIANRAAWPFKAFSTCIEAWLLPVSRAQRSALLYKHAQKRDGRSLRQTLCGSDFVGDHLQAMGEGGSWHEVHIIRGPPPLAVSVKLRSRSTRPVSEAQRERHFRKAQRCWQRLQSQSAVKLVSLLSLTIHKGQLIATSLMLPLVNPE